MGMCMFGFYTDPREACGDQTPTGKKYCSYHWELYTTTDDFDMEPSVDEEIQLREWEIQQDALADYRDSLDSGQFDRDPRDYA